LVQEYLEIHQAAPATLEKLRWLLGKATLAFGEARLVDLRSEEICAWPIVRWLVSRMNTELETPRSRERVSRTLRRRNELVGVVPARGRRADLGRYFARRRVSRTAQGDVLSGQHRPLRTR